MTEPPYWFASFEDDARFERSPWRACLQWSDTRCVRLELWFGSKESCEDFIRTRVLNAREITSA